MLSQIEDGFSVSLYSQREDGCLSFVEDFLVDDMWFVLFETGSWAVECEGKCLGFDSSGACEKIE